MGSGNDGDVVGTSQRLLYFPVAVSVIHRQLEYDISKSVTMGYESLVLVLTFPYQYPI